MNSVGEISDKVKFNARRSNSLFHFLFPREKTTIKQNEFYLYCCFPLSNLMTVHNQRCRWQREYLHKKNEINKNGERRRIRKSFEIQFNKMLRTQLDFRAPLRDARRRRVVDRRPPSTSSSQRSKLPPLSPMTMMMSTTLCDLCSMLIDLVARSFCSIVLRQVPFTK